jgi:hypothetical protein
LGIFADVDGRNSNKEIPEVEKSARVIANTWVALFKYQS